MSIGKPFFSGVFLFFVIAFLSGCKTVRQAREAQAETDLPAGEATVSAARAGLESVGTYALTNLVRIALESHPSVLKARQAVESARIQVHSIRGERLPSVSAGSSYSRDTANSWGYKTDANMRGSWSGSLSLDLLVYDFGKRDAKEKAAIETLVAAEKQFRQTQLDVVYAVQSDFFELLRSAALVQVSIESEKQYAEHLNEARTMAEVGTRRPYDVTKAEVDWGNARLSVITDSNTLITARAQLTRDMGLAEETRFAVGEGVMPDNAESADRLMARAKEEVPSLAVLAAKTRAASFAVDQAIADLYPDLSAGADASLSGRGFPFVWNFSWAAKIVQDLFTGFRKTDAVRDAVAQLRTARANQADAEQSLYLQLVQAVAKRESSRTSLTVAEIVLREATQNLEIVNEQYRVGLSSSVERTDAQVALTQAKSDVVRARYDYQTALAHIVYLTGQEGKE